MGPADASHARVGVLLVAFESANTLAAALAPLGAAPAVGPVVVVDNASTDGSADVARAGGADVVALEQNLGFGAGVDIGLARLRSLGEVDHVLVLNPDARIESSDLARLGAHLDDHPRCALVGPRLYRDAEALTSAGREATLATELRIVAPRVLARKLPDRRLPAAHDVTGPVGYVEGACTLVRLAALDEVDGFGPGWFLFYEELDLARRFRRAGWTVDLCAEAAAHHAVAVSRGSLPLLARPHLVGAGRRYVRRWHGRSAEVAFTAAARGTWRLQRSRGLLTPADHDRLRAGLARPGEAG